MSQTEICICPDWSVIQGKEIHTGSVEGKGKCTRGLRVNSADEPLSAQPLHPAALGRPHTGTGQHCGSHIRVLGANWLHRTAKGRWRQITRASHIPQIAK